jgi:amyloid beta precursor protein binding protein 1
MDKDNFQLNTDIKRYDRQLRLWGEDGQDKLEKSNICLLNASSTGTETLKNLVLPGIGSFTIVDGNLINESDFNNFFISEDYLGKSRAVITKELLNELNDRVKGNAIHKDPIELIENEPNFFKKFNIIIANNLPEDSVEKLAKICWECNIALFIQYTWGLLGYLRIIVPEHTVIEAKLDNPPDDLRLTCPFPALLEYALSFDFNKMNSTEHSHIPYIIILLQALEKWKATHEGNIPQTFSEKKTFKDEILKSARKNDEENFNEAFKSAHKAYTPINIPENIQFILTDVKCNQITKNSEPFWILANALKCFIENEGEGKLPLMGSIPDMTSTTEGFIKLQQIYQNKSKEDIDRIADRVKNILNQIGKNSDSIPYEEIKTFCKNSYFLQVIRYRSLDEEKNIKTAKISYISSQIINGDINMIWYLVLGAGEKFYANYKRYPGDEDHNIEKDIELVKSLLNQNLLELGLYDLKIDDKYIQELVRFGGCELHTTAAFIGGITSQEIIKIITHQFVPMNNTFIFNGIQSTCSVFQL